MSDFLAPQQLFDGSFFEAVLSTPQLKAAPPDVEIEELGEAEDNALADIETFDWEAYNHAFFERIPESAKRTEEGRQMAQIAGTQIWMARRLPGEVIQYLLRATPAKMLWSYLSGDERQELLKNATRGFQRTPQIVRQPVVRSRLFQWFQNNPEETYILLVMWSFQEPPPPVIHQVRAEASDCVLNQKLPSLMKKFGVEAAIAAVAIEARPKAFRVIGELLGDKDELLRLMQNDAEEEPPDEPQPGVTALADPTPQPDSAAALFWKNRCDEVEAARGNLVQSLEKLLDSHEKSAAKQRDLKAELELLQKREKTAGAGWEKKLEYTRQRAQIELDELRKNYERQGRKLRALEREKLELETENRRFKKQLRHSGQLLEEERKKIAVLEANQSEGQSAPAPVEALMTPAASQSAPNRPVVVQSPTPLDEIFEWRADGRPVKITPRAVRRLIDANDEDAIFPIMQALEALAASDASLHSKFLKRLGEAGAYYPRVLSESMTRVLVDASNVARHAPNRYGKGQLRHLLEMREELRRLDCFPILFYADASLPYFIDEATKLREMIGRGEILMADKGTEADEILAREARRTGAYVVTNDAKFWHKVSPDFEPARVSFRIYDSTVIVDDF